MTTPTPSPTPASSISPTPGDDAGRDFAEAGRSAPTGADTDDRGDGPRDAGETRERGEAEPEARARERRQGLGPRDARDASDLRACAAGREGARGPEDRG